MRTIRLLGGASIHELGGPATARAVQRSRMALLALLALSRTRSCGREHLMALLWPDSDTARARHLLRESLYRLRETLGNNALVGVGDEIRLDASHADCDVWDFEAAVARRDWQEADRLYTGPLLDGVFLTATPEFERWADGERARLAEVHAGALEALAIERGDGGNWIGAVELWRRRALSDPHNARVAVHLMEALDAAGDRASALRHADAHVALLASELDAAPDPAVVAFAERLRRDPVQRALANSRENTPRSNHETGRDALRDDAELSHSADSPRQQVASRVPRITDWFSGRLKTQSGVAALLIIALITTGLIRTRVRGAGDALNENRIAILPFRTSAADSTLALLRDGLVELLSLEFTGDVGPQAVDAGETLRAWRRAGGASEPTTPAQAMNVGRELGAGQVAYGAVVGTATQFTITISVLRVADGSVRVSPVQVFGTMDSLPSAIAALSAKLLARSAGTWRLSANDPEHTSTEVLRAYLRGMVAYRDAHWVQAGTELFHAVELDSTFVPAAYRFALVHAIVPPSTTPLGDRPGRDARFTDLYRGLWNHRQRLSAEQRLLLEAVADSHYVLWKMQALPRLQRAVALLPASVEAWDILGDDYYHAGALIGHEDWAESATKAFARAKELDSTIAVNARMHLADLAFMARDAREHTVNTTAPGPRGRDYLSYQAAILRGSTDAIRAARVRYARGWARGEEEGLDWALTGVTLEQQELDSLIREFESSAGTTAQRRLVAEWAIEAAMMEGRPAAAVDALWRHHGGDSTAVWSAIIDYAVDDRVAEERLAATVPARSAGQKHPDACNVALARLRRGDSIGATTILASEPALDARLPATEAVAMVRRGVVGQAAICGQVLRGVLAARVPAASSSDDRLLFRADSIMRFTPLNYADFWNYDLALALAHRGHYAAAARTVRRHFIDLLPLPRLTIGLRHEGRWAALAGDTAAAIKAYRHYLLWRQNPEPALVPQRDSVRAELAALQRSSR